MLRNVTSLSVAPAYGQDYSKAADVQRAWDDDRDFLILALYPPQRTGRYINKSAAAQYTPKATVEIRYCRLTKVYLPK